jgi:type II secretion system protein D
MGRINRECRVAFGDVGDAGFDGSLRMARIRIRSLWPKRWLRAFAGVALATGLASAVLAAPPDPSHLNREADDPEKGPDPREKQPVKIDPIKVEAPKVEAPKVDAPKVETKADPMPKVDPVIKKEVKNEPKYSFEFRDAPWGKVVEWFTGISGLAYVSTDKPPTGTFQFIPPKIDGRTKQYTIVEIIDILNVALYSKGYILTRRDESFTLLPVDVKPNPSDVPPIEISELKNRGSRELVQVIVPLKTINPLDLEPELKRIMSTFAVVTPLERSGAIVLIDQVMQIKRVLKIIEDITDDSNEAYTRVCQFVKARHAEEHLIKIMGDPKMAVGQAVQQADRRDGGGGGGGRPPAPVAKIRAFSFASDDRLNAIYVNGPADIVAKAKKILDDFDKGTLPIPPGDPLMKTYDVEPGSAEAMVKALEVPFKPSATLRVWALGTNKVMAWAGPQDQADIARFIEGQKTEKAEVVKNIPLRVNDAAKMALLIKNSYADPKGAPYVIEDERNNLFVRGTPEQIKQVEMIIAAMGDGPTGGSGSTPGSTRAIMTIKEGGAANLGAALEKMLRDLGHEPKLIRPGFEDPKPPEPKDKGKDPAKDKSKPTASMPIDSEFVVHNNQIVDPRDKKKKPGITITAVGNKIFIESDDPDLVAKATELIRLLTVQGDAGDFTVIRLKKANAAEVARIIDQWFNPPARGGGSNPLAALFGQGPGGGGMQFGIGGGGPGGGGPGGGGDRGRGPGGGGGGGSPTGAPTEQTRVRIVADASTNSLLVRASFVDIMTIKDMLDRVLDRDPDESDALVKTHMIKLLHASAVDVVSIVREVFREYTNQAASQSSNSQANNPFAIFGGQQGRQQPLDSSGRPKPVQLSLSYDDRTNSIVVACPTKIFNDVDTLVKQLDNAAKDASRTVKVVSVKGIDPMLVQQAVDAIQGRRPSGQGQGRGGMGQGGFGGGFGQGGNQFGGGFGQGGFGQGGINPGFGQGQGGFGQGGFGQGGFGGGRGGGQGGFGGGQGGFGGGRTGFGGTGGGRTSFGGGRGGGGGRSPDAGDGERGPDFFESRGTDAPSKSKLYDPRLDSQLVQAQYNEPAYFQRSPNLTPTLGPNYTYQDPPKGMTDPKDIKGKEEPPEGKKDRPRADEEIRGLRSTVNIEALEELGVVVISANTPADLEEILKIIAYLQKLGAESENALHIMPLEYGDATSIVNTMNYVLRGIPLLNQSGNVGPPPQQIGGGGAIGGGGQLTVIASSGSVTLIPLPRFNAILIGAARNRIPDVIELIKKFDRPLSPQSGMHEFPLKRASAQIVAYQVQLLYNSRYPNETAPQNQLPPNQVRVTFDVRTNTVFVQAGPADLEEIRGLIERIDSSVTSSTNELRIVRLKNALADELAGVLIQALIQGVATQTIPQLGTPGGGGGGGGVPGGGGGGGVPGGGGGGIPGGGGGGGIPGGGGVPGQTGTTTGRGITTKTTALRFISENKEGPIESGLIEDAHLTPDIRTNSLIVSAPPQTMKLIMELVKNLDVVSAARAQINVFSLKRADAVLTATLLQQLFSGGTTGAQQGGGGGGGPLGQGQPLGGGTQQGATRPLLSLTGLPSDGATLIQVRISVDDRTNSIIVAGTPNDLETIAAIISRLEDSEIRPHMNEVIKLRNAAAADVVTALQTFFASSLTVLSNSNMSTGFQNFRQAVVLASEPVTNTILISASAEWFPRVLQMIERLDMQPLQVSVKCMICEVRLTNTEEFGVEIGLQSPIVFNRGLVGTGTNTVSLANSGTVPSLVPINSSPLTQVTNIAAAPGLNFLDSVAAGLPGFNIVSPKTVAMQALNSLNMGRTSSTGVSGFVFSGQSDTVNVLVRALKVQGRIDILNQATIKTLDNQLGTINVGQSFPYVSGGQFTALGTFQPNVDYNNNVGVTLRVTPRISPEGRILMRVEPSLIVPVDSQVNLGTGFSATAFNQQIVQTTVLADDGETIVIGGLISKVSSKSENKLPFFGDLPYIGTLFRYRTQTQEKRELIIVLTPSIIRNAQDSERVALEQIKLANGISRRDMAKVYGPDPLLMGGGNNENCPPDQIVVPPDGKLPAPAPEPKKASTEPNPGVAPAAAATPANGSVKPVQDERNKKESRGWSLSNVFRSLK